MYRHPWTDLHGIIEDLLDGWVIQDVILAGIRRIADCSLKIGRRYSIWVSCKPTTITAGQHFL